MAEDARRGPGRPPNPDPPLRAKPRPVRLDASVDDALCVLSHRHGVSIHALLKLAARMLVECDTELLVKRLP
jgi:hypothetical protein